MRACGTTARGRGGAEVQDLQLVSLVCCDLGSITRGRSLPAAELERHLAAGVSWVPANQALTPLGPVAEPNPFGSTGDLRLMPDPGSRIRVAGDGGAGPLELLLCDIVELDGSPWAACPRRFLREALEELERADITLSASFEHEFQLLREPGTERSRPALPFSLEAQRGAEPFATQVMGALLEAGVQPERFFPEYARTSSRSPCRRSAVSPRRTARSSSGRSCASSPAATGCARASRRCSIPRRPATACTSTSTCSTRPGSRCSTTRPGPRA